MTKVAVLGAGRMGREVVKKLLSEGFDVVAVVDAPGSGLCGRDAGLLCGMEPTGVTVSGSDELAETLDETKPDVVVDFTSADACVSNVEVAAGRKINLVIGTTGFTEKQLAGIEACIENNNVGAVISPNMSVGVNVFWRIIEQATRMLADYDIEVIEAHHRFKKDAPSGTAVKTAEVIAGALGKSVDDIAVYGRQGMCPRKQGELGIHAIRAGDIVGDHTVLFGTLGERVEIKHQAHSREAFAAGVPKAVDFVRGRKGVFGMSDVLGLK